MDAGFGLEDGAVGIPWAVVASTMQCPSRLQNGCNDDTGDTKQPGHGLQGAGKPTSEDAEVSTRV